MNIPSAISGNRALPTALPIGEGANSAAIKSGGAIDNALNIMRSENEGVDAMMADIELDTAGFGELSPLFEQAFSLPPPPMPAEIGGEA